MLGER
jgi:quercetin dioxygenase-like cupin family protein